VAANCFQNAAVWSFEYSAATSLIDLTVPPPLLLELPVPPPHADSATTATPTVASNADNFLAIVPPINRPDILDLAGGSRPLRKIIQTSDRCQIESESSVLVIDNWFGKRGFSSRSPGAPPSMLKICQ
jgi:hypothetical protein